MGIAANIRYFNMETRRHGEHLIYSATRVAPTKHKLSIPKKELNGIVLAIEEQIIAATCNIKENTRSSRKGEENC